MSRASNQAPGSNRHPAFAKRFEQACDSNPSCPPMHDGRLTWIRGALAAKGLKVSLETVSRWYAGDAAMVG